MEFYPMTLCVGNDAFIYCFSRNPFKFAPRMGHPQFSLWGAVPPQTEPEPQGRTLRDEAAGAELTLTRSPSRFMGFLEGSWL